MFISKLIHTVENYDPYGVHRLNGIKVVYVLLVLFGFNGLFYIPDAYFYLFYVPITAMTAEVLGQTIHDKYLMFIATSVGSIVLIYIFNVLFIYPAFFLYVAFLITLWMYKIVLHRYPNQLVLVPIILSLVSYSLNNRDVNQDIYAILNHAITTSLACLLILGALLLFPLRFYYRLWLKTLYQLASLCLSNFKAVLAGEEPKQVPRHTVQLITFSQMVPRTMPTYSLLKITMLMHQLCILGYLSGKSPTQLTRAQLEHYIVNLSAFVDAIKQEKPCPFTALQGNGMLKIIRSWNHLCQTS